MQAIATTAPDLLPMPGVHPAFARGHEYKPHGTLSLLAGIDLLTGKARALVRDRPRSREFIDFLKLLDAAYPAGTAIKLRLDNHSAHISRETRTWLDTRRPGRFELASMPKHASWLNLIEPLLQVRPVRLSPHPREFKTRVQGAHHGRHRRHQSLSSRPHLVLQTRRGCLN
ncbi:transposase [Bradyrhizobium sp. 24]|nr:transposase [Bradyrhizobium sp. 37]MCK1377297.1 transposase [Bradyrhizobium sp. 24]MCK1769424.1 transposase [Bradyrhizobium sp. 134]